MPELWMVAIHSYKSIQKVQNHLCFSLCLPTLFFGCYSHGLWQSTHDTHCHLHCLGAKPQSQSHGTARPCHSCDHPRRQSVCNSLGLHGKMRGVFGSSLQLKKLKFCWHMDMRSQTSRSFALAKTSGIQSIYKRAKVNLQAISPTSHDYVLHYSSQIRCYEAF